jgi:hypothetical protein
LVVVLLLLFLGWWWLGLWLVGMVMVMMVMMVVMVLGRIRGASLVWCWWVDPWSWMDRSGLMIALLPDPPRPPAIQLLAFVAAFLEPK